MGTLHRLIPLVFAGCVLGPYTTATNDTTATTSGTDPASTTAPTSAAATNTTAAATSSTSTTGGTTVCAFLDCGSDTSDTSNGSLFECDLWTQDCPDGQKCMPWAYDGGSSWNASKCTDIMPNAGKPGDPCTVEGRGLSGVDSCEKSAMCWNISQQTGMGTCIGFCTGSPGAPMCPPLFNCTINGDATLILCLPGCHPLTQACPDMDLCIPQPMGDGFTCVLDGSGDMGQQNDPCDAANACKPGLVCVDPDYAGECDPMAPGCCLPFCDLTMPQCTNQGAQCVDWYEPGMAPPGLEDLGICRLPP